MTLPEYYRLCRYWQGHPPVHLMVAGYLGIRASAKPTATGGGWDIAALIRMAPGGYLRTDQLVPV